MAAALVSALADKPLPKQSVWFGEVSLSGEIRSVAHAPLRLRESAKLGFDKAFGPSLSSASLSSEQGGVRYDALDLLIGLVDRVVGAD